MAGFSYTGSLNEYLAGVCSGGNWANTQQMQEIHKFCGGHMYSGNKPLVVCGGEVKEAKDMDDAQAIAESLAHSKSADAYILKPVKKVAPKRDVVTTDLV
jgi:hypothetical protein